MWLLLVVVGYGVIYMAVPALLCLAKMYTDPDISMYTVWVHGFPMFTMYWTYILMQLKLIRW
jgi:hypothetical protein